MSKQVFISPIDEAFLTERDTLGDLRWEGNRCYKYVKLFHDSMTLAGVIGDQLLYSSVTGHSINRVVLGTSEADSIPVAAGVCNCIVAGNDSTEYFMWMQIKGPAVLSMAVSGSPNDGQLFMATLTDKQFGLAVDVTGGGDQLASCGIIQDASIRLCLLDLPF